MAKKIGFQEELPPKGVKPETLGETQAETPVVPNPDDEGWENMGGAVMGRKIGQNAVLVRDTKTNCTMALEGVTIMGGKFLTK